MVVEILLLIMYLSCMVALVQYKGDTSIANFTWGGGVLLATWYTFFTTGLFLARHLVITTLITLWAVRLIVYVYMRYTGHDPRFAAWKWQGLKALVINIGWIFGQTIMILIMGYPAYLVNTSVIAGLNYLDFISIVVWVLGYICEAVSDYQLFSFMRDPSHKGQIMQYGLWRYSRHPNYFGEIIIWWGLYGIALSVPYGWTAIIAPVTISFLLRYVTGVPWVEKALEDNVEYQEYKKRTNTLIPWFVKK